MTKNRIISTRARPAPALNDDGWFASPTESVFEHVAWLAAELFQVPAALVALREVDGDRLVARAGRLSPVEMRRGAELCTRLMDCNRAIVIPDTSDDEALAGQRWALAGHRTRFFAGHPVREADGEAGGALVLLDRRARGFSPGEESALRDLAELLELQLDRLAMTGPRQNTRPACEPTVSIQRSPGGDDDVTILLVDIDAPAELEDTLGRNAVERLNRRLRERVRLVMRDGDRVEYTPHGDLVLFIHGGERAAQRVAYRLRTLLNGARLTLGKSGRYPIKLD